MTDENVTLTLTEDQAKSIAAAAPKPRLRRDEAVHQLIEALGYDRFDVKEIHIVKGSISITLRDDFSIHY